MEVSPVNGNVVKKQKKVATDVIEVPQRVEIRTRTKTDWDSLFRKAEETHWRKLSVKIQLRDRILAGKPKQLDAAQAMLKARGLEEAIEAVNVEDKEQLDAAAEKVVDEGLCEFHRRTEKPGLWFPTNNLKACLKENWSVMGYRMSIRGSRGALAEGIFVVSTDATDRDWIYLGEKPAGIEQSVAHTMGPKGPQASIKRNEYLIRPVMEFEIWIAAAVVAKVPDKEFADMLLHAQEHGIGAGRSQGFGRFDLVSVEG